jgi:hypothetical protein
MDKEFVTYEQALALKELGFDEQCFGGYAKDDKTLYIGFDAKFVKHFFRDFYIPAPLKQQVFRWFREKYKFCYHIFSLKITASDKTGYRYSWEIYNHTPEWIAEDNSLLGSLTYEEAENAAIDKLIEIAKQQKDGTI